MNNNSFDKKNLENILSGSTKIDRGSINEAVKTGKADKLISTLSAEDKEKLTKVLNDKKALSEILKSPQAMALIKLLGGGKKNG